MLKGSLYFACIATMTLLTTAPQAEAEDAPGEPLRVLILTGRHNHDWAATTPFLKSMYEASGRFAVAVTEDPASLDAAALDAYDVLVDNWAAYPEMTGRQWGAVAEEAIVDFVRNGGGMVLFHAATASFADWPEFNEMAGCTWGETAGHGKRHRFNIEIVEPDHPITRGLRDFTAARDELYHGLTQHPPFQLLARSFSSPSQAGSGRYEPMLLTKTYGEGRCFYTAMGHDVEAMAGAGFRTVMLRGTEWAATGEVALAAPDELPPAQIQAVVVTGGHDFDEAAFPKLFAGHEGVAYTFAHQAEDSELFEDIADWPYDVIVLYNMGQHISEKRRANFAALLERGVGLVALHHAVAAYAQWPEFDRILGARYYLEEERIDGTTHPRSTYEHDVDFTLHIADAAHPITAGLADFAVHDETYNGMDHDPANRVLVTTDHPSSAKPIGWTREYEGAPVFYLQVGHGPQVFTQPEYQTLVRRAVEWAAGRGER